MAATETLSISAFAGAVSRSQFKPAKVPFPTVHLRQLQLIYIFVAICTQPKSAPCLLLPYANLQAIRVWTLSRTKTRKTKPGLNPSLHRLSIDTGVAPFTAMAAVLRLHSASFCLWWPAALDSGAARARQHSLAAVCFLFYVLAKKQWQG